MTLAVHENVVIVMAGVVGLLVVSSAAVALLGRLRPDMDVTELRLRVRTWWGMVAVFAVAMVLSRLISIAFFAVLSFLALREFLSLVPTRRADRRVLIWPYLSIPVQFLWVALTWYGMFVIWIPVYAFLFLPARMVLVGETSGFLRAVGTLHWGLMTTVYCLSHVAYLLVLPPAGNPNGGGPALVLYLVLLTQLNDVAQYTWGRLLGRTPVAPVVSPKKTLEGALGGLVTTAVLAPLLAPLLTPLDLRESVAVGVMIALAGLLGDLVMSALKRDLAVKDSGTLLPGHGGVLDRLDSLTYTAPLFFHFVRYTHF